MQHIPSGFFYRDRWQPTFCNLPNDKKCKECLFGRHFSIIGDSTSRQWYSYLRDYLNCTQVTEKWTRRAWHKRSMCENKSLNFTASYIPHAQPLFPGDEWRRKNWETKSTAAYLGEIEDERVVVVIHLGKHLQYYRSEIFEDRMNAISRSVRHLLGRNNNARVLIKGPHTFYNVFAYQYYIYRAIIKESFKDLYDRVVFMEQGDMSIAKKSMEVHPAISFVREAVRQLIGYSC